ncbi:MAG TPA: response regulator transcription factor [Candidatus Acidoferrales bacterium]|nr:response regulator transcription factor [Candidatus Acidoferrales bacterium]
MASVLIADDKAVARRALLSIFEDQFPQGVTCTEALDGVDAVEKARELHPDVVILDLVMPRLSGLKAAQEIMRVSPGTSVLAVSNYDPKPLYGSLRQAGVRGFVPKCSAGFELIPAVESILRGKTFFGLPSSFPVADAATAEASR